MGNPTPAILGVSSSEGPDVLEARLKLAREILGMFKLERGIHLALNAITFVVLIGAAVLIIYKKNADKEDLTLICGSGGLIGFTSSRLLTMWTDIINRVLGK
jgi:hypothetical protein